MRARLSAEQRVQREIEGVAKRARAAVVTPAQWIGYQAAGLAAWGGLLVGALALWTAYGNDSAAGMVLVAVLTAWSFTAARWVAVPAGERAGHHGAAAAAVAAALWLLDLQSWAVAFGVVVAVGSVFWLVWTGRARKRLHRFAWAAAQLADATGDTRALHRILAPAATDTGLPARWYVPEVSTRRMVVVDDDELVDGEDPGDPSAWAGSNTFDPARVLSTALGTKVAVKITRGIGVVCADTQTREAVERRDYDAQLAKHVRGRVTDLQRDDDGAFQRLAFTWPAKMSDRVASVPYQARIVKTLQTLIGVSLTAKWDLKGRTAVLTVLPPLATSLPRPGRNPDKPMLIGFAQKRGGTELVFDLDGTLPHIAIGGGTGAGKTVLARTLLLGLPRPKDCVVEVFPIDPKMIGFLGLEQIPGVHKPADDAVSIVNYLERVHSIMMARYDQLKARSIKRSELVPLVLLIDEGEEMADILNDWWASGEGKEDWQLRRNREKKPTGTTHPAMKLYLGSILRLGRAAHVHVIAASQQFSTAWLSTSSRSQFGVRIAVSNLEASTSEMLFGSRVATAGLDGTTPGRAWVSIGRGAVPVEAQIYWTPEIEPDLNDSDRAILHNLGVRLPDDPDELVIPGELAAAPLAPVETPEATVIAPQSAAPVVVAEPEPEDRSWLVVAAAELVLSSQYASTAMLTRKLRVSHAEAVALLDELAGHDVVAAVAGGKYEVLLPEDALASLLERLDDKAPALTVSADGEDQEDADATDQVEQGEPTNVLDLLDGMRVLVDVDGVPTPATVVDVAPDDVDEDYLAVTYLTDVGESGVLSCTDDEHLPVLTT